MWFVLIFGLLSMSTLTILQIPREWFKKTISLIGIIIYHSIGILSIVLLLWFHHKMENEIIRDIIVDIETFYFVNTLFGLVLSLIRYFGFEIARHFQHRKIISILNNKVIFYMSLFVICIIFMFPGIYNSQNLKNTTYEITIDKKAEVDNLNIVGISDLHVGAGAKDKELKQMVDLVNKANADIILIAGDVCDSSSSKNDLSKLTSYLKMLKSKYGIYYVEGNHEDQCNYDYISYLKEANVNIINNKVVNIKGLNIIGRDDSLDESLSTILDENNITSDDATLVLQHRPCKTNSLKSLCDVMLCGHTHGYQFPFFGLLSPLLIDYMYGKNVSDNTNIIVTSGVSEWGFEVKYPSQSEIVQIKLNFKKVN